MNSRMISQSTERFDIPEQIAAAESKLVYLFLSVSDGATVDELQASLDIQQITLLPVLDTLSERGLVERVDGQYVAA
ncbi:hypothetical protein [Haloplanus halobius]|uniref:hypothetical protein n=1 Tax=Haloplanus halobius TaxID=2934938 RepID=UPI00200DE0B4|nr:hypothetical protein [Haloplanus sp. XH21]